MVEEDKGLRLHPYKSEILINKVFYVSFCVLGEVEEINKKELLQSKAQDSKFIPESPPDLPRVDGQGLLRVQHG